MTTTEVYKETLLTWLRHEVLTCRDAAKFQRKDAAELIDSESWDISRLLEGQAIAYEDVIRHIRGLKEREFQLEKKRGTL